LRNLAARFLVQDFESRFSNDLELVAVASLTKLSFGDRTQPRFADLAHLKDEQRVVQVGTHDGRGDDFEFTADSTLVHVNSQEVSVGTIRHQLTGHSGEVRGVRERNFLGSTDEDNVRFTASQPNRFQHAIQKGGREGTVRSRGRGVGRDESVQPFQLKLKS